MSLHDLRSFGAVGDGCTFDGAAFTAALTRCANDGGGTIVLTRGTYLTGSLRLPSRTTLRLEGGATILGSRDFAHYPLRQQMWEGKMVQSPDALIWSDGAEDLAVVGQGTIDGQGKDWWQAVRAKTIIHRPRLVSFQSSTRVVLSGLRLINSPAWTVHPWRCSDVTLRDLTIINPPDAPNTDGIDPESCTDVRISGCLIDVGDDAIVLKSGTNGTGFPPCERVTISDCIMRHGHGGIVIGSEMSGGVRDVVVTNCLMQDTDRGIRIKTRRGRGGSVENLSVSNVLMRRVGCPIVMHMYYKYSGLRQEEIPWASSREPQNVDASTPAIRGIRINAVTASEVTGPCLMFLYGLPEMPIDGVSVHNCVLEHRPEPDPAQNEPAMMIHMQPGSYPTCGLYLADVRGLSLSGLHLRQRSGPAILAERVDPLPAL
jgi:polygalacturonase